MYVCQVRTVPRSYATAVTVVETLDISENTSLESLEVTLGWTIPGSPWAETRDTGRSATSLLAQIHSQSLHTLVFHIRVTSNVREPRWSQGLNFRMFYFFAQPAVDGSMVSATAERVCACAAKLRKVTLDLVLEQCLSINEFAEVEYNARRQLPLLTNRGILHVQQSHLVPDSSSLFLKYTL